VVLAIRIFCAGGPLNVSCTSSTAPATRYRLPNTGFHYACADCASPDFLISALLTNQSGDLRTSRTRHLADETTHLLFSSPIELFVTVLPQSPVHPRIDLLLIPQGELAFGLEMHCPVHGPSCSRKDHLCRLIQIDIKLESGAEATERLGSAHLRILPFAFMRLPAFQPFLDQPNAVAHQYGASLVIARVPEIIPDSRTSA
jgi:hypothetical protein